MKFKNFFKFIGHDEIIVLYDPFRNIYLERYDCKQEYDGEYDGYEVIGVNTNVDDGYNAVLEIDVMEWSGKDDR